EDKQYRSWKEVHQPQSVAVIIYMMDVSGSMTDEQKEIVRIEAFWIDTWIEAHYRGVETAYIIHDAVAHLVDEHTFYHTRESGGTKIPDAGPALVVRDGLRGAAQGLRLRVVQDLRDGHQQRPVLRLPDVVLRAALAARLNEDRKAGEHQGTIQGELCPFCRQMFTERPAKYDGDWNVMLDEVKV